MRIKRVLEAKMCKGCAKELPLELFAYNGRLPSGRRKYRGYCRPCWLDWKRRRRLDPTPPRVLSSPTQCRDCGVALEAHNKVSNGKTSTGKRLWQNRCVSCWRRYASAWRRANRTDLSVLLSKDRMLQWHYGITLAQYNEILSGQRGLCAVCLRQEEAIDPRLGEPRALAVDHCHVTNRIRGLLCSHCNRALGLLREDAKIIDQLLTYIRSADTGVRVSKPE